ncbi:MAG: VTT domain-containing protein [Patescibacteria group bacterium]|nr:VTT domain-containing protein [Patescibacteria group bacterium]
MRAPPRAWTTSVPIPLHTVYWIHVINFLLACIHLDPIAIVQAGSYLGLALLVFAESGIFIGMFLPGDSLLFAAGLLAAGGFFALGPLMMIVVAAAILGDSAGYWFGSEIGGRLFERKDSRFFKQEYLQRTERFYEKYGGRTLILARFVPIVRTIAPILAGTGTMTYRKFLSYNIIGGFLWGMGMILVGFFLGSLIPNSETYILPLSLVIVVLSFFPILHNLARGKRAV